jgi:integrase
MLDMLGSIPISKLTTAQIRLWHKTLTTFVSVNSANIAKKFLRAALCLAAEDFALAVPPMPSRMGRGRPRPKKRILAPEQVGRLLRAALEDERGIYYAFPFLTGVRPGEQLALTWDDIDLAHDLISIRRSQQPNGYVTDLTKTAAGMRDVPISPLLHAFLVNWQAQCPRFGTRQDPVFPAFGRQKHKSYLRRGVPLRYNNFLYTYWRPALARLQLPRVTPHSARHAFISTMQAQGVEVGLVAKLVGHANATITLEHYTQAVRGGDAAVLALEAAYRPPLLEGISR